MKNQIFRRFDCYADKSWSFDFKQIELIPQVTLIVNSQEDCSYEEDDKIYVGFISYELLLSWLSFCVSVSVNVKTGR